MVFESVVSDLLNRVIGDYVENLDKSQLKIGIWGGNVVLENLKVKENALSDLNVPFKVKAGQIGKLTLKIPWKNLYSDAVVATLDGLYLLLVPGAKIKFDADKEERDLQERKQKELQRIEEALSKVPKGHKKVRKRGKGLRRSKRHRADRSQEEKKDTFVEKLATQVIKNLQVKISSIHLRFEDDVSDPSRPLSMGVTLSELSLQTTDENWKSCILNETAKIIYKLACLDCLCAYWNVDSSMSSGDSWQELIEQLKSQVSSKEQEVSTHQYIFKPIFASAKICINPNAEQEMKGPKVSLHLEVQDIGVEMSRPQYLTMVELLESIDCMVKNAPYRKFRPDVGVIHNAKLWWRYCFNSIMEVHVQRLRKMWSWSNIRQHRNNLRAYKSAYKSKLLSQNKLGTDTEQQIQDLEKVLDVFNITLARQQAQMEVIRSGQKVLGKNGQKQSGGFFSSWFGRKAKKEEQEEPKGSEIDLLLTSEEKEKLYVAIGYSGSFHNLTLPRQYVGTIITFQLLKTSVTLREHPDIPEILKVQIIDLCTTISQRPGAQAIRVEAALKHWVVTGLQHDGAVPSLVASVGDSSWSLLTVVFEKNPEDSSSDQLLHIHSQPVELIYDAGTVNSLVDFFRTEKGVDLEVLTSATLSKLEEIKEKTATGLSHIIETRKVLDLRINLKPSYLVLPKSGFYRPSSELLIVDFGSFQLHSVEQSSHGLSSSSFSSLEEIMDRAYERFSLELRRVQVLYSKSGEAWKLARLQGSSLQHILHPLDVTVQLAKCMVEKDARMPRFKVCGELPLLHIRVSDQKILQMVELVQSVPLPRTSLASSEAEKVLPRTEVRAAAAVSLPPVLLHSPQTESEDSSGRSTDEENPYSAREELVDCHFKFEVKEMLLELTQQEKQQEEKTILTFSVAQMGAEGKLRPFDLSIMSYLRRVCLDYCDLPGGAIHLVSSSEEHQSNLLKVEFIKADASGPSFHTQFGSSEQTLKVELSSLDFLLHTKALLSTISYFNHMLPPQLISQQNIRKPSSSSTAVSKGAKDRGVFSLKLLAQLLCIHVEVCDDNHSIADIQVQGIDAAVSVQATETVVFARLRDLIVTDANLRTVHRKAVSIVGDEVFSFHLRLFSGATEGDAYSDVSKVDGSVTLHLGCIQIIYLHKFYMSLLASFSFQYSSVDEMFIDNFQTAKEALSSATAQAAEKAASSVRHLAQKSFRLSMDVRLKAPLIIVPQSSTSHNALVMDLGLITVRNSFSLLLVEGFQLPAVMETMNVHLTQLKLSRTKLAPEASQLDLDILQPIDLELLISRNLATSWFSRIPAVQIQGVLRSLHMSLCEEDLGVVMKILAENIGEGSKGERVEVSRKLKDEAEAAHPLKSLHSETGESSINREPRENTENTINLLLDFEIKEVLLALRRSSPFLLLCLSQLGINTKVRKLDMCATTYIHQISVQCPEFKDCRGAPVCLVSSRVESGAELLKVQYLKADRSTPNFSTTYKNTEQMITVTFSSLDFTLHTEALLSTISFLSTALSSGSVSTTDALIRPKVEFRNADSSSSASVSSEDSEVIDLKVMMTLGAFNILVCDQTCDITDLKIQGLHGSLLVQGSQTHFSMRLQDFTVLNVDPQCVHQKVISIMGDEVFSFSLNLTPNATEGSGYSDTSRTDGRMRLNVGCVRVVYLHRFIMNLLNFTNSFQEAKEAVSAATAQAAEKAASSVRDFAHKTFRLSMDIRLKAPIIMVPQCSTSHNALLVDLGLITVGNSFSLLPVDGRPLPAVIDNMEVKLTELKLSRICMETPSEQTSTELLEPVNLDVSVRRNLSAAWYKKIPAVDVDGDLKPMKLELSQDDLKDLLRILFDNLSEAEVNAAPQEVTQQLHKTGATPPGDPGKFQCSSKEEDVEEEAIKFNFNIKALSLVLYNSDSFQPLQRQHNQDLRLGELAIHLLNFSGGMQIGGGVEVNAVLKALTLDDLRSGVQRASSRMLGCRQQNSKEPMIDVTFRQSSGGGREVVTVLQQLYLCASVEFLLTVGDFFLQALPQTRASNSSSAANDRLLAQHSPEPRAEAKNALSSASDSGSMLGKFRAVVVDPEVVFVASLKSADAPALVATFQCDLTLQTGGSAQSVRANLRELKVLACPFIRDQGNCAVTTVLRPCSIVLETKSQAGQPVHGSVTVEEVIVKISPFIINTVTTITAAMMEKRHSAPLKEDEPEVGDLWSVMNIYGCNFWFLGVEPATEVTESFRDTSGSNDGESFAVDVKVVQVTLESGLGHRTVPLLLAESSLSGSATNWSSLLHLNALMTLEVNYFNESHAVWEPLIERVDGGQRRWTLQLEMKTNPLHDKSPVHGDDFVLLPEPRTSISICSRDTMNITVSQSCLSVFQNLQKAFSEGTASTFDPSQKEKPPFTVVNSLGIPLILHHSSNLRPIGCAAPGKLHELLVGESMDLEHSVSEAWTRGQLSALQRQESCLFSLSIVPSGFSEISNIPVDKPGRRLYNIRGPMLQEAVSVLLQIDAAEGNKVITVRSPLQIKNHFSVPFNILKYCPTSHGLQNIGLAEPETDFHVALETYRSQLFVQPAGVLKGLYEPSSSCLAWKEQVHRSSEVTSLLQCPASESSLLPLRVSALAVPDKLRHIASHGEDEWDPAYVIHLQPVATLRNFLPYTVRYMMESSADSYELAEGSTSDLLNARVGGEILSVVLVKYQGRDWHGHLRIHTELPEFFAVCLTCDSDLNLSVDVSVHISRVSNQLLLSLFSPYWIINKTSRVLQYRAEDVSVKHPADFRDVILFSFKKKNLFTKSKIQLCVSTSSWSEGFSLDTVGSYGCVRCPGNNMDFLVGVSIQMSSFNLSRIVTMSPFFTLVNRSSYELEVGEVTTQTSIRWHYISSTECLPLWPEGASGKLCVRVVGSDSASKSFFYNRQDNGTLLSMDMCGGILVDINVSDHSNIISFSDYYEGAAPALLLNHTPWVTLSYTQSGSGVTYELKPGEARRFVWDDPTGVRLLHWSYKEHSGDLDLLKDAVGQFPYDSQSHVHWVSFLDGRQRMLLFTEDVGMVTKARQAEELEQFEQEVKVSLQNLGLSLVNNSRRQEVAYIGITSSGVVWEMRPKNRWKPFSQKNINLLEKTFQDQQSGRVQPGFITLDTNLEVNLSGATMMMRRPYSCQLRRNFLSGIHVEFKQSQHQRSLRAQLHRLQVDNQLPGAIFPIVFHPVPPPKSVALDSEPRPFIDVSVITRFNRHSSVTQFKYFMALIQEMAVKVDQGFLGSVLALFPRPADLQSEGQKSGLIKGDLQKLQAELMEASLTEASGLSFFQHFHISPIKLHLSLSLDSSGDEPDVEALQSLNLLLKSIGATLTDVDDLIFKLAYFEVKFQFYRRETLMWAVGRHYSEQFLKQMYVLVLGLDVLGNPFGLIRGLSEGVEAFFYEPFQGAVQGPEEFAEGVVIGVRSLLGHTVGGAAGVVSRITGSVGKGLAAITMDKEFQQKRREEMSRPPKDFGESLAKGGKGLLKGVVGGVTGIVTKPVEGAKKEGAAGFFKGIGKGLVGVVARPTGGIVDMASSTFQGIQRAAESTEEVSRLRPVRLIREDGIIRPYDLNQSQGFDLFQRSEIKQLEGEVFRDHCVYPGHRKTTIIVTNRRVLCVKEIDFVNHFNKEWECLFENFHRPPEVHGTELKIFCKEQQKLSFPKKGQEPVRTLELRETHTAQKLQSAIFDAQLAQQQRRMARKKSQRFLKPTGAQ